jgi:glycosyltransferase involved in cell wall biosynthesis
VTTPDDDDRASRGWVCFSAQDWWYFSHAHSDFQLMTRVAATRPVLFVNSITVRMPLPGRSARFTRRILRKARSMTKLLRRPVPELPDLGVLSPVVFPFYGSEPLRRINAYLVAAQVRFAARRMGLRQPVCFVTIPTAVDVVARLDHGPVLYNRSDKISAFREANQDAIATLEHRLLRRADRVLYVSHALMHEERVTTDARAVFLDHGVDATHFQRVSRAAFPTDVRDLRGPVIGFFGGFDDYLVDLELIACTARANAHATVLLIGDASGSMRVVEAEPNVRWLGPRPYAEIPAYGSVFDVAIMPWLDNEWIRYANPIKLKEYLALGLPVVSTDFPEVHRFDSFVRIANDTDAFIAAVRQTLDDGGLGTPQTRRAAVVDETWDARVAELLAIADAVRD